MKASVALKACAGEFRVADRADDQQQRHDHRRGEHRNQDS
jgi:hypothetical protein